MGALGLISEQEISKLDLRVCVSDKDFIGAFNDNMKALGFPTIEGKMKGFAAALAIATTLAAAYAKYGKNAKVIDTIKGSDANENLKLFGTYYVVFTLGAIIGSIYVASVGRAGCGKSIRNLQAFQKQTGLDFTGSRVFFANNPELISTSMTNRDAYAKRANS